MCPIGMLFAAWEWLAAHEQSLAVWIEGGALVAIFWLDWRNTGDKESIGLRNTEKRRGSSRSWRVTPPPPVTTLKLPGLLLKLY